jgi:ketosteroid isomerase-like protein
VTLFAARGLVNTGSGPVRKTFEYVASTFSGVENFEWTPLASGVSGDLAYTAALERYTNSRDGGPPEVTELRATHVYRREDGRWHAVHRHADRMPLDGEEFNQTVDGFREALRSYVKGDPEPALGFFSGRDDVTLANPLEAPRRGPAAVAEAARKAAAIFQEDGPMRFEEVASEFEEIVRVVTADLGYLVQIERHQGRLAGTRENIVSALRATLVIRREGDTWKISHRHADPILSERKAETLVQA